jgi:hypothetical protein
MAAGQAWPNLSVLFLLPAERLFRGPSARHRPELARGRPARANGQMTGATYSRSSSALLPSFAVTAQN